MAVPRRVGRPTPWEEKALVRNRLLCPIHSPLSGARGMLPFLFQTGSQKHPEPESE